MTVSNRVIQCVNEDGVEIIIAESGFSPFLLTDAEGLYDVENTVYISENSMIDGAVYQGSVTKFRNIVLTVTDTEDYPENRGLLDMVFKKASIGTLTFWEGSRAPRKIEYVVENMSSTGEDSHREHEISLICPDPHFYDVNSTTEDMASWVSGFEFEFESDSNGFEFGYKSNELIKTIQNDIAEDGIGIIITITCGGAVTNPSITHIETGDKITIGHSGKPFSIGIGDTVTITTATGNKHVTLTRNGITSEINHYLTEDSVFIQLMRGTNSFGFDADSGLDNLSIEITYTFKYARA